MNNENQTFQKEYRELDAVGMAMFRAMLELTIALFRHQTERSESECQKTSAQT